MNPHELEEALFAVASELSAEERSDFLDRACLGDTGLRARLEALLLADADDDTLLERPVREPGRNEDQASPESADIDETIGDQIGNYRLIQKIGEGGWGSVYLAEQIKPFRRRVALKVIKLGMDTRAVIARFEIERKTLAMMDHPGIARVLDAGATTSGRPFFVMELVRGDPITRYCDEHQLTIKERLELFIQVCDAIRHAHQKGMIHRDIKPSNILVTLQEGIPRPKIIDFGIAKATHQSDSGHSYYTDYRSFVGTPVYTSPEQIEMSGVEVDTRSDIYSLGVVLYELLTGRLPFERSATLEEVRESVRGSDAPRPSVRTRLLNEEESLFIARCRSTDPRQLVAALRSDLDWIVMRCLEKDQTRRYPTANGLAMDLQRFLSGDPVAARPPSTTYLLKKLIQRHRFGFAAGSLLALALIAGLTVSLWAFHRERVAYKRVEAESWQRAQVIDLVQKMFQDLDYLVALGRDTKLLRELLDLRVIHLETMTGQPEIEADLRKTLGAAYFNLGEYGSAEAMFRRELALRTEVLRSSYAATARTLNDLGAVLIREKKMAEAEARIREALAILGESLTTDPAEMAASVSNLGVILAHRGQFDEAEARIREALRIQIESIGPEHPDVAQSLNRLGVVLEQKGELAEAEATLREALAMKVRLFGPTHPSVSTSLIFIALVQVGQDQYTEALSTYKQYLKVRSSLGEMDVAVTQSRTAFLTEREGTFAEVSAAVEEILRVIEFQYGKESWEAAKYLGMFGWVLLGEGKYAEAEAFGRRSLVIREATRPDHWLTYNAQSVVGGALAGLGRTEEAEPLILSAARGLVAMADDVPAASRWFIKDVLIRTIRFFETTGDADEVAYWQNQLAIIPADPGSSPPRM